MLALIPIFGPVAAILLGVPLATTGAITPFEAVFLAALF